VKSRSLASWTAAILLALAACAPIPQAPAPQTAPPPPTADQRFEALAKRYLDEMPALWPVEATQLGDHRFDARLNDVGVAGHAARADFARRFLEALEAIDRTRLTRENQVDAALLRGRLRQILWEHDELQDWRWNPLIYTALAGDAVYSLGAREFAPWPERARSLESRLTELPRMLAQVREVLDPARVPKIHAETAVKQNGGVISLIDEVVTPQLAQLPEGEQASVQAAIDRAKSAVSQHQIWLEKRLLPEAKGDFRIGAELYDAKLRLALDSPLSREEIRQRAEEELARVRAQMYELARGVLHGRRGAPARPEEPSAAQQQRAIAAALELAYADRPAREEVFDFARRAFEETLAFVREKDFVTVYDDPIEIIPMPEFQRGVALAYCDPPGPLARGLETFYAISPIPEDWTKKQVDSFLREYNRRSIHELTIHEAAPGHYLQFTHANRHPSTLRAVLWSGTFVEGWAMYGERVMIEQGYMDRDPLMQLVHLKWYLRAIANALLDQGVHVDGMTREEAMTLMTRDTFQEEREAAGKWVRAQLTSAQLPTYFVGFQEHLELREEASQRAGASFDLKGHHDRVLSFGSPPVRHVRALMFGLPIEE
jgi:uncharacterized protein (DUF885 family)